MITDHPELGPILAHFQRTDMAPDTAQMFRTLAVHLARVAPGSAETMAGLRKLLEARDCARRAALPAAEIAGRSA